MRNRRLIFLAIFSGIFSYAQIGINIDNPDPSSAIDINHATNKAAGFLPPRIGLQSDTDGITITSPANGLIVYNTNGNASGLREGLTMNVGTSVSPLWRSLVPDNGVRIGKLVYFGPTINTSKALVIGGFEFRYTTDATHNYLQARLLQSPASPVTLSGNRLGWVGGMGVIPILTTWNSSDWNQWKQLDFMADGASHVFYLNVSNSDRFYKISSFVKRNDFNSLVVEIY